MTTPAPGLPSDVARLREAVDAVLVPRGFTAGQPGMSPGRVQVVWCAATADLAARFPGLPIGEEPPGGWGGRCTDVDVEVVTTGGEWRVLDVDVEGRPLDRVLADLGRTAAAERAAALTGGPVHEALAALPPLLAELLDGAAVEH